ncbi:hypothetical protein BDC45DRAFT_249588 [Circinella umbellata]|nr:hypothetical protein BDC45DRAFT_249588 [Circinella umbellata]
MSMPIRWSGSNESSTQQHQQQQHQTSSSSSSSSTNQHPSIYTTNTTPTNYGMDPHSKPGLRPLQPQPYMQSQPQHHDYASSSSVPTSSYPYPAYYRGPPIPPPPTQQQHHLQSHGSQPQQQQQTQPILPNAILPEWRDDRHDAKRIRISRACDGCRRKKIKCDTSGPGTICKNCQIGKIECTFNDR